MDSHVMEDTYQILPDESIEKEPDNRIPITKIPTLSEEPDDRIPIANSSNLDKILQIAVNNISKVAELLPETQRAQLVTRFTETFREIMHENVSLEGGMPWATSGDLISTSLAESQAEDTEHALLSKLAVEVGGLARRRKTATAECSRKFEMQLKHERQNLKKCAVDFPLPPPQACAPSTFSADFPHQELAKVLSDLSLTQTKIHSLSEELPILQANFQAAKDIVNRQKQQLDDTGYTSG